MAPGVSVIDIGADVDYSAPDSRPWPYYQGLMSHLILNCENPLTGAVLDSGNRGRSVFFNPSLYGTPSIVSSDLSNIYICQ